MPLGRFCVGMGIWKLPFGKGELGRGVAMRWPWGDQRVIWTVLGVGMVKERVQALLVGLGQTEEWNEEKLSA